MLVAYKLKTWKLCGIMKYKGKIIKSLVLHIFISLMIYPILKEINLFKQYNIYIKVIFLLLNTITICFCIYFVFNISINKTYILFSFISYCLLLAITLYIRKQFNENKVEDPKYLFKWIEIIFTNKIVFINIIGNVILFIPLGVFIRFVNIKIYYSLLIVTIVIVNLELIQYIYKTGVFDIVDIILNVIGVIIGLLLINKRGYRNGRI